MIFCKVEAGIVQNSCLQIVLRVRSVTLAITAVEKALPGLVQFLRRKREGGLI